MNDDVLFRRALLEETVLLIPAFNPDDVLYDLVRELRLFGFRNVVVINDGSDEAYSPIFSKVDELGKVVLIRHERNLGKGAALKSGIRYVLERLSDQGVRSVITLDADGQHRVEDVLKVARETVGSSDSLFLGVRDFSKDVPWRSQFGNTLTRQVLKWTKGIDLNDTQTGLRGIPLKLAGAALGVASNRYEFELECIVLAKRLGIRIVQVPIRTIYIDDNRSSHFRPIVDSIRIYIVFFRFVLVSGLCFAVDIVVFLALYRLTSAVIASTYLARIVSSSVNFAFNKYLVFRSKEHAEIGRELVAYVGLAIVIATMSAFMVRWAVSNVDFGVAVLKIVVDSGLFIVSFLVQRFVIFGGQRRPLEGDG